MMWRFSAGNRPQFVLYVVMSLLSTGVNLVEPLVVAVILNKLQTGGLVTENLVSLAPWLSLFVLVPFVSWLLHGPARVIEQRNAFLMRANYKQYLFDGVLSLNHTWHVEHHSGDTIDKIEKGTKSLYSFAEGSFMTLKPIVTLVGSYAALAFFNIHAAYIVLAVMIVATSIVLKFDSWLVPMYKRINEAENKISEKIFDTVSNITTVIILRVEPLVSKAVGNSIMEPYETDCRAIRINELKWFLVSMIAAVMTVGVLGSYVATTVTAGGVLLAGTIYALYGYVNKISGVFFNFAWQYSHIVRQRTSVANAEELSKEFREIARRREICLPEDWKELRVSNLNFSYHTNESDEMHLDNIEMTIKNGERIAVIGESGSGKSTFLKVVRELYVPESERLEIDGVHHAGGFADISSEVALIPQDPEIFSTTILENITLGVEYELDHVKKFTDMARFTEVAENLPHGFESSIVEKGVNLSGGEKQRLALARGLLASADKEFVLLDEPTSSVDSKNERMIYENIFREFKGKTIISSIHRLHLLPLFSRIYLFEKGVIKTSGSFDELLEHSPEFQEMWQKYTESQQTEE